MKYSIITPVYNREDCIARCIESVMRQVCDVMEIEHIIVNDGSDDRTGEICREYAADESRVRYIEFSHNKGTNAARNAAIKAAEGDYIIILDSDDYFVDDALSYVDNMVRTHAGYRYYMFAPDDID